MRFGFEWDYLYKLQQRTVRIITDEEKNSAIYELNLLNVIDHVYAQCISTCLNYFRYMFNSLVARGK